MAEIMRHGNADKVYSYFICDYCGCEFKMRRGDCSAKCCISGVATIVTEVCPDCGSYVTGMTRAEYLQELKMRAEADAPLPENEK